MPLARARVGLDARMDRPPPSGLGRYARSLTRALTSLEAPEIRWVIIKHPALASTRLTPDAEEVVIPHDLDHPLAVLTSARAINRLRLDLYHSLENFLPLGLRTRLVVITTHDLLWVEHPELAALGRLDFLRVPAVRLYGALTMRHAYRRSNAIVAVSEATRQTALRRYRFLPASRIRTIHPGVDRDAFPWRAGDEPADPFFLLLGNTRPNKNVGAALVALSRLRDPRLRLVVAGRGDRFGSLSEHAARLGVAEQVDFVRRADDRRILSLLHAARGLLFPSLVEGFGLPLLEAMSAGCPVLASAIPAAVETCGGAALHFDPRDPDDLARAMREVLASRELRDELRARGQARVAAFDWRRSAEQILALYRELLARS